MKLTAESVGRSVSHFRFFKSPPPFQRKELMQPLWANSTGRDHQNMRNILCLCKTKDIEVNCVFSPLILSTRYSWLAVMSRYWTMTLRVGIAEALTTAACLRLLILASSRNKKQLRRKINLHNTVTYIQKKKTCYPQSEVQDNPFFSADCWLSRSLSPDVPEWCHLSTGMSIK